MFEPWKKFDAKQAASLMNEYRKILRREHAGVRKLLRRKSKDQKATDLSERVNALRQIYRNALQDQISVCDALNREILLINFGRYLDAFLAQSRLSVTCNEVARTIEQFSPTSSSARPHTG